MTAHRYVGLVGLVAVLVGLVLLFVPVSTGRGVDCGSLVDPNTLGPALHDAYLAESGSATSCDDSMASRRGWTLALIIGGVVVGVGAWVTGRSDPRTRAPRGSSTA